MNPEFIQICMNSSETVTRLALSVTSHGAILILASDWSEISYDVFIFVRKKETKVDSASNLEKKWKIEPFSLRHGERRTGSQR